MVTSVTRVGPMHMSSRIFRIGVSAALLFLFFGGDATAQVVRNERVAVLAQPGAKTTQGLSGCKQPLKVTVAGAVGAVGFIQCGDSFAHCVVLVGHQFSCTNTSTDPNAKPTSGVCGVAATAKSPAFAVCEVRK